MVKLEKDILDDILDGKDTVQAISKPQKRTKNKRQNKKKRKVSFNDYMKNIARQNEDNANNHQNVQQNNRHNNSQNNRHNDLKNNSQNNSQNDNRFNHRNKTKTITKKARRFNEK